MSTNHIPTNDDQHPGEAGSDASRTSPFTGPYGAKDYFDDLSRLRLFSAGGGGGAASREVLLRIPVRKPARQEWYRVHADPQMSLTTMVFEDQQTRDTYIVDPDMWSAMPEEFRPALLCTVVTRQNVILIWPVKLPLDNGLENHWVESGRQAAELAKTAWTRMSADLALGAYRIYKAIGDLDEPHWPEKTLSEYLAIAFKDRVIDSEDHPVIRRLRGLA